MRAKPKAALVQADLLNEYLGGGAADAAEPASAPAPKPRPAKKKRTETGYAPRATVQKLFRFREDTCQALRVAAILATDEEGRRVTETEIVERIVRKHLRLGR